ncbi:MAG: hypothetical protein DIZ80_01490 [endosymbiont of Galathealinum brachiosum]|uniref:Uncharacterized protein n=1 Tax=endosymbiont of Galathealinum brachiosum TaxID=2200906 RepID=A0A370DM38_9GAMM|nr:MAG: hypothetical protein DIZ80_01490 [endosymbiont of Galathealinum brachiosum]
MNLAIQYFDQNSPGVIIAGQKDGSDDLGVYYTGDRRNLEILRDLINEAIDQLQAKEDKDLNELSS